MKSKAKLLLKVLTVCLAAAFALIFAACDFTGTTINNNKTVITLSASTAEIEVGKTVTLSAQVSDNSAVTWISGSDSIASVDQNGVVTGISVGQVVVTAVAGNGMATCTVTVTKRSQEITVTLSHSSAQVKTGDSITLTALSSDGSAVSWSTSDESVATVENGIVTGISEGSAIISASSGAAWADCFINVVNEGETLTISISKTSLTLKVGESSVLTAVSFDGKPITWESSDSAVASVSAGKVTALSEGDAVISAGTGLAAAECKVTVLSNDDTYKEGYTLVWNDEFNGDTLDTAKWNYQLGVQDDYGSSPGPIYWGNNELQYYTKDAVSVKDGSLVITATRKDMADGRTYSSGRITTRDNGYWTYGYFEARMKTPALNGMWPAFWMLPQPTDKSSTNNVYGSWAANGEIDIMEAKGRLQNKVDTTLHYGNYNQSTYKTATTTLSTDTSEWHIYGLEWRENYIAWFIDGTEVMRVTSSTWWSAASSSETAPFDQPFYILFDLAVGGNYDGGITPDSDFTSASMYVDYVRVYA